MKAFFLLLLLPFAALAQNHPELDWQVIESEHFRVLYHQGLDEAAQRAAQIAEEAYGPVTELYGYRPGGKVRILIKDYDDYANGAAYYYHDTIEIWATALDHDFELRGATDWLRNVITHEFTHIVSLGAALKAPQRVPALYLQYFGYQRERNRPDVLVGYPDVLASYPVTTVSMPMWFAEGVAQHQAQGARHDRWDSHRDMILRSAVLSDSLLSFDQMGVFGKCGFGNEYVYDHGYGLVRYIAQTYGDDRLAQLCRAASGWRALELGIAIHQVLGLSADQLHRDWHQQMKAQYQAQVQGLGELREGEVVVDRGFSNQRPVFSPDGKRLAYLSTRDRQFGPHALVVRELETSKEEVIAFGVSSTCSWSPDSQKLVVVRHDQADKYGSRQADLYEFDLGKKERGLTGQILWSLPGLVSDYERPSPRLKRLSRGLRALYPAYSPDGQWIAFVQNGGTHNNLGLMRADGTEVRKLTQFTDGTQLYTPQWSPDGQYLVFSIGREGARDLARLRVDQPGAQVEVLVATAGTDRDPVWNAGGREVIFASDFSGIFNLYSYDLETQAIRPLTNVKGGALTPSCSPSGQVAFAAYGARGFQIRQLGLAPGAPLVPPAGPSPTPRAGKADPLPTQPYGIDFLKTSLLPRLLMDEGRFKGGLYLSSGDVLSRQGIFAGAAYAPANGDRDLFAIYEYRGWRPTTFLEFSHQRRASPRADTTEDQSFITTGTVFNLNQLSLGLRGNAGRHGELALSLTYDRYDASITSRYFDPQQVEWVKQKPFGYTYLQGFDLGLSYRFEALARRRDQEISPRGRQLHFRYDRLYNFYIKGFREGVTFIDEDYLHLFYNQLTLDWHEHLPLPLGGALGLRFFGGLIASKKVDDEDVNNFFDYHLGGIQYMKGYTYYSIEGRKAAMGTATLRFPIFPDLRRRFLHLYFDKLYGAVYGDLGKAWDKNRDERDPEFGRKGPLRDVGGQLRMDLFSYYSMPTRIQADLAYGIDEVSVKSPWKFYLTVLFGYL